MTTAKCRGGKDRVTEDIYRAELAGRSWGWKVIIASPEAMT
jgi:hypothetical protein